MAEENVQQQAAVQTPSLADVVWGGVAPEQAAPVVDTPPDNSNPPPPDNEEIVDANEYLKTKLGYENWDAAQAEIEELRKLKEQKPFEFKFENETSEKLFNALKLGKEDEVFNFLDQKNRLERASKLDVSDAKNAADVLRLNLKLKYKDLNDTEINDIFQEQYDKPNKPVQRDDQLDEDYQAELQAWQMRVDAVDRKIIREAKLAKPDIEQAFSKLVLPDIPVNNQQAQGLTQEELDAQKREADSFIAAAGEALNSFNEIQYAVKNNDVDLSLKYSFSQEEKTALSNQLKQFAETNFDANALFASRWLTKDGKFNFGQMVEDLSLLNNKDRINEKFISEAANQAREAYIKGKKNITVGNQSQPGANDFGNKKTESELLAEQIWGA